MSQDHVATWNQVLESVRRSLSPKHYNTWFSPIKPVKLEGKVLTLEVPNEFFLSHLENHYLSILKEALVSTLGQRAKLEYRIAVDDYKKPGIERKELKSEHKDPKDSGPSGITNPFVIPGIKKHHVDSNLNPHYQFENFIEGHCNRVARQAGIQICQKPGDLFNPLVIFGDVGLGKTHLMQAIGNAILKKYPKLQVIYLTSDKYTNLFIQSIRNNSISDFSNFFNSVDVLIIDDIQYFAGKAGTQEIFFHLFNQMHQNKKQIIMGSDRAPKDLKEIDDRLISRFKWGASLELMSPDYETLMAILESKLEEKELSLPKNIKELICHNMKSSIREIEGLLVNLKLHATLNPQEITVELVKDILASFSNKVSQEITIESITKIVAEHLKIPIASIQGKGRQRNIVQARQLSMFFSKRLANKPLSVIGEAFGGKDHSTVIYSCETVENLMQTDKNFEDLAHKLEKIIIKSLGLK